jgi:F-type H+-transporting ATPase subunit delta
MGHIGPAPNAPPAGARDERNVATDDTIVEGMAGRYASALFDLAKEASQIKEVEAELTKFKALLDESEDLRRMVRSPVISSEEQARAMDAIMARAGIGGLAGNFLKLLSSNRRLFAVGDMSKGFRSLAAKERGEVTAEVASAVVLSDAQVQELKTALKATIGKDVTLATRVDPSLLGGLVVKVGSRMIDSSLKTKLQNLKVSLNELGA